jgi:phosphoribosylaminoimidazole-succinocarboxamide synthase
LISSPPVLETDLPTLTLYRRGKVRDVYVVDADHLLIVATDRISAFDYVLGSGIPDKGKVLTQLSAFWFDLLRDVVPNHVVATDVAKFPASLARYTDLLRGRSMLVRRTEPLPVECVARGYISGSGWKDYRATGRICGIALPEGLRESDRLPSPIFTPATKAQSGHDENISDDQAAEILGHDVLMQAKRLTLQLYARGAAHAAAHGILLADTKFEFGIIQRDGRRELLLIDEALTPDSSRFWPADQYAPGRAQASYDKQFVRDYLESIKWNKQPPVPALPDDVVVRTRAKYLDAFQRLTGHELGV